MYWLERAPIIDEFAPIFAGEETGEQTTEQIIEACWYSTLLDDDLMVMGCMEPDQAVRHLVGILSEYELNPAEFLLAHNIGTYIELPER